MQPSSKDEVKPMTTFFPILAVDQAAEGASPLARQFPHQGDILAWCQSMSPGIAALLIMVGIVYLLFGLKIFKAIVLVNASILGAYLGAVLGATINQRSETVIACALLGAFTAAAASWPAMKYSVALMGGIFGALLGASIWRTVNLEPQLVWAGALVGLIGFGMLSFILFRGSLMMYTSLQGAIMLIFGILGLIYKYQQVGPQLSSHLQVQPLLLPIAIFIPAVVGWIFQHHNMGAAPAAGKK
jgi:hypothetical protein